MMVRMVRKAPTTIASGMRALERYPSPAPNSRTNPPVPSSVRGAGRGIRNRKTAEITYVAASSRKAASTPTVATSSPPSAGPTAIETLKVALIRAFARVRSPSPTTLGKAARMVGLKSVRARPIRKIRAYSMARSRVKTTPTIIAARTRSLPTRIIRRSKRSARTPANGLASVGKSRAIRSPPTAGALPVI